MDRLHRLQTISDRPPVGMIIFQHSNLRYSVPVFFYTEGVENPLEKQFHRYI